MIMPLATYIKNLHAYYSPYDRYRDEHAYLELQPQYTYRSNEKEMIYIDAYDYEVDSKDVFGDVAESLAQMVHYYWMLKQGDFMQDPWIVYGISALNRYLCGYGHIDSVLTYAVYPYLSFFFTDYENFTSTLQGGAYLFILYLYERYGLDFIRQILQSPYEGISAIDAILNQKVGSMSFEELYNNWEIASYVDDPDLNDGWWGYKNIDIQFYPSLVESTYPVDYKKGIPVYYGASVMIKFSGGEGDKGHFYFSGEARDSQAGTYNSFQVYGVKKLLNGKQEVFTTEILPSGYLDYQVEGMGTTVQSVGFIIVNNSPSGTGNYKYAFNKYGPKLYFFHNPAIWNNLLINVQASGLWHDPKCWIEFADKSTQTITLQKINSLTYVGSYYFDYKKFSQGKIIVEGTGRDGVYGKDAAYFSVLNRNYKASKTSSPTLIIKNSNEITVLSRSSYNLKDKAKGYIVQTKDGKIYPYQKIKDGILNIWGDKSQTFNYKKDVQVPVFLKKEVFGDELIFSFSDDTIIFPEFTSDYQWDKSVDGKVSLYIPKSNLKTKGSLLFKDAGGHEIKVNLEKTTSTDIMYKVFPDPLRESDPLNIKFYFPTAQTGSITFKIYDFTGDFKQSYTDSFTGEKIHQSIFQLDSFFYKSGTYFYKLFINFADGSCLKKTGKFSIIY
jgi:hypothetical protein